MTQMNQEYQINCENVTQSDTFIYDPPLDGVVISAPGAFVFKNGRGESVTFTVGATATDPFTLWGQITQIMAATAQADADILGFRRSSQKEIIVPHV